MFKSLNLAPRVLISSHGMGWGRQRPPMSTQAFRRHFHELLFCLCCCVLGLVLFSIFIDCLDKEIECIISSL